MISWLTMDTTNFFLHMKSKHAKIYALTSFIWESQRLYAAPCERGSLPRCRNLGVPKFILPMSLFGQLQGVCVCGGGAKFKLCPHVRFLFAHLILRIFYRLHVARPWLWVFHRLNVGDVFSAAICWSWRDNAGEDTCLFFQSY